MFASIYDELVVLYLLRRKKKLACCFFMTSSSKQILVFHYFFVCIFWVIYCPLEPTSFLCKRTALMHTLLMAFFDSFSVGLHDENGHDFSSEPKFLYLNQSSVAQWHLSMCLRLQHSLDKSGKELGAFHSTTNSENFGTRANGTEFPEKGFQQFRNVLKFRTAFYSTKHSWNSGWRYKWRANFPEFQFWVYLAKLS